MARATDQEILNCVEINRGNLNSFLSAFQISMALFDFLRRGGQPPNAGELGGVFSIWRVIAARDGALNIYHFGCTLEALRHQSARCHLLDGKIDRKILRQASKTFHDFFPHIDSVRHAIAHAGELSKTPEAIDLNYEKPVEPGGGRGLLNASLDNATYTVGITGQTFSVAITAETIGKLQIVIALVNAAFQAPA